ncbi:hypothetical protein CONLIGDRAFT_621354 [Coniochaeta ligniaria NRRL 30616]|uniref:Zn(2)-C6 fungal-type domain-containing protein n=1 Tax=Coniochaeta ligniaria NRRL 30616 TaxID=1408157 RepID=A0A1J7IE39_9PEZI|nr:hypothetical protein CONLIGDRAFT_621354 [Coniochaeta ligniaria NRRL 30616]
MSNNRYKPILPAPILPRIPSSQAPQSSSTPLRHKRTSVRIACNGCRAKRTACDGERPSCRPCIKRGSQCVYVSTNPVETPAMVMKREMESLRKKYENLAEAFDILRDLPEDKSIAAFRNSRLVTVSDPAALLASIRQDTANSEALPRQVLVRPPAQDSKEFELMLRHAIAYPTLVPLDSGAVSVTSFFPGSSSPRSDSVLELLSSSPRGSSLPSSQPSPGHPPPASIIFELEPQPSTTDYCDDRLLLLEISSWTSAPISNALAASLISLYLKVDHPTLGLFDGDLFMDDLIQNRIRYCSPLLVSSILVWACNAYSTLVPILETVSDIFLDEATVMWEHEQTFDSLPTVAAAQLLNLACIYNGDNGERSYMSVGSNMAQRMGLFGPFRSHHPYPVGHENALSLEDWDRAAAHTAWGVFNCVVMNSFIFQSYEAAVEWPPLLEIPGASSDRQADEEVTDGVPAHGLPEYMGRTFPAMCGFWAITSEWISRYYLPNQEPVVGRVPWEFTQDIFKKLLSWTDGLHFKLARGDQTPHHSAILHIWLHASISQLFRPFARTPDNRGCSPLDPEEAEELAKSVFEASIHQLKHMSLGFRNTYDCSSYAIFWHMALLYVANAALEDINDPQWRAYFNLCLTSYGELFGSFRVAEGIVRSLLSIALRKGMMSGEEVQAALQRVNARKGRRDPVVKPTTSGFVVDLNLAVTDREGAQLEPLNELFDTMRLFNEFIDPEVTESPNVGDDDYKNLVDLGDSA